MTIPRAVTRCSPRPAHCSFTPVLSASACLHGANRPIPPLTDATDLEHGLRAEPLRGFSERKDGAAGDGRSARPHLGDVPEGALRACRPGHRVYDWGKMKQTYRRNNRYQTNFHEMILKSMARDVLRLSTSRKFARKARAYRRAYREGCDNEHASIEHMVKKFKAHRNAQCGRFCWQVYSRSVSVLIAMCELCLCYNIWGGGGWGCTHAAGRARALRHSCLALIRAACAAFALALYDKLFAERAQYIASSSRVWTAWQRQCGRAQQQAIISSITLSLLIHSMLNRGIVRGQHQHHPNFHTPHTHPPNIWAAPVVRTYRSESGAAGSAWATMCTATRPRRRKEDDDADAQEQRHTCAQLLATHAHNAVIRCCRPAKADMEHAWPSPLASCGSARSPTVKNE